MAAEEEELRAGVCVFLGGPRRALPHICFFVILLVSVRAPGSSIPCMAWLGS